MFEYMFARNRKAYVQIAFSHWTTPTILANNIKSILCQNHFNAIRFDFTYLLTVVNYIGN